MPDFNVQFNQKHIYNYLDNHLSILQENVASFTHCNLRDLNWKNYQSYAQHSLGLMFQDMQFPEYLKDRLSGMLLITPKNKKIVTNTSMPSARQHFTKMHELVHFWEHTKNKPKVMTYKFTDMVDKGAYDINLQSDLREIEANIGAGILMINNWQLYEMIVNNYKWNTALSIFEISNSAFYYRVRQFLENELNISSQRSYNLTVQAQNRGLGYLREYCKDWYLKKISEASPKTQDLIHIEVNNPHWK